MNGSRRSRKRLSTAFTYVFLILIVLPVVVIAISVFFQMKRSLEDIARENVSSRAEQMANTLYDTLNQLQNLSANLMLNDQVRDFMDPAAPADVIAETKTTFEINRMISFTSLKYHFILRNLFFLRGDGEVLYAYERAAPSEKARAVCRAAGDFRSTRAFWYAPDATPYYIVNYTDSKSYQTLGTILIELDLSMIPDFSSISTMYPDAHALLTHGGQVLFASHDDLPAVPLVHSGSASDTVCTIGGKQFYYFYTPLRQSNIWYHVFIPAASVLYHTNRTFEAFVLAALLLFILLTVSGAYIFRRMLFPLGEVAASLEKMAEGNLSVRMLPSPYLETDKICTSFNTMADKLDDMLLEVYDKGLLLKEAELDLLQSQISPHFLFNVLESINMHCAQTGDQLVSDTVVTLSHLLRSNILLKDQQKISIEQELSYVGAYLYIQKLRFAEKLTYSIELEDRCIDRYLIPKLVIQPLVENAVVHGLEEKCGGGHVSVRIWEEDCLYIRVSDNGVGFDAARPIPDGRGTHIALDNIRKRIALHYGAAYGLTVRSRIGQGTEATIMLPIDTGEENRSC